MCEVKTATTLHLPQCAASHRSALSCVRGSSTTNTVTPHSSTCSQGWPVTTATLIITVEQALQCLRQTRLHVDSRTRWCTSHEQDKHQLCPGCTTRNKGSAITLKGRLEFCPSCADELCIYWQTVWKNSPAPVAHLSSASDTHFYTC